jgi:hypothetical protein
VTTDTRNHHQVSKLQSAQLRLTFWLNGISAGLMLNGYLTLSFLVRDPKNAAYETSVDSVFRNENVDRDLVASGTDHQPHFSVADGQCGATWETV